MDMHLFFKKYACAYLHYTTTSQRLHRDKSRSLYPPNSTNDTNNINLNNWCEDLSLQHSRRHVTSRNSTTTSIPSLFVFVSRWLPHG